ncbi:MAG: hypothetical protein GF364_19830 [Candidatus Lokiarchaeota archaeon]|nr:hypothetical protein [Candidatus Lokiarchaeota archaeon]
MFSKSNSIKDYKDHAVLVSPNLGKPQIRSFPKRKLEEVEEFELELLYIAPYSSTADIIRQEIIERIKVNPLIDLDKETRRAVRGEAISGELINVQKAPIIPIDDPELILNYPYESPRGQPIRSEIYADKNTYYLVKVKFEFTDVLKAIIHQKGYAMCDITQSYPNEENLTRINYHSVVLTNQTWENFTIIHGTDLHVAKRNDEVLAVLLRGFEDSISEKILKIKDFFTMEDEDDILNRFINPNNNIRLFCILMNRLYERKRVDLVFLTGDLIDFCVRSDGGDNIVSFDLPNTNWSVLRNLILNLPLTYRSDIEPVNIYPTEELLVPIFTVVGNHDYRSYHYDLRWATLHKVVNVKSLEMMHYNDIVPANPITSLYVNRKTMMAYNQYMNAYQNYHIELGDHIFLFMDTEYDSAKATKDLFMGSPSANGFHDEQLQFMKNVIKYKRRPRGVRMALFHAPVINPLKIKSMGWRQKAKYRKAGLNTLEDFKEESLKEFTGGEARADPYVKFDHGSIANNWEESLKFFHNEKILVLNGHTHKFREFRTYDTDDLSEFSKRNYFILKKNMRVPVAIYMDDYSLKYTSQKYFNDHLPFHLQTPSLGVGTYQDTKLTGAFRVIKIRDNKLESFRIDFLSNYKKLLPEEFAEF